MNVLHIASQSAGILSASPHISCGWKQPVSQEIRGKKLPSNDRALTPQVGIESKDIKTQGTAREGPNISLH